MNGGAGDDVLDGGCGADVVHGGVGNDTLTDESGGADQIFGDDGDDSIGIDRSTVSVGHVVVDGGAGNDNISSSFRVPTNSVVVELKGGDRDDTINIGAGYLGLFNTYGVTADGGRRTAGLGRIASPAEVATTS